LVIIGCLTCSPLAGATPAPASARSPVSTSTTCAARPARARSASTANAARPAKSASTKLRTDLEQWLSERLTWPGAGTSPALFLNTRGGRLSVRAASGIIATIAENARLDDETTAHILRHTFATTLVRGKTDLIVVAELMGHTRLETTRRYSLPTEQDKAGALGLLTTDR
jgi:hypothetical protein